MNKTRLSIPCVVHVSSFSSFFANFVVRFVLQQSQQDILHEHYFEKRKRKNEMESISYALSGCGCDLCINMY